jgi:hypothetical protein
MIGLHQFETEQIPLGGGAIAWVGSGKARAKTKMVVFLTIQTMTQRS